MDTDDLTEMAWDVIVHAAHVSDTLKAELGAMTRTSPFKTEDEWLRGIRAHLAEIGKDPVEYVDSRGLENAEAVIVTMIDSIAVDFLYRVDSVLTTPIKKRGSLSW